MKYTTAESPAWEQVGWLKEHIRQALAIIDTDVDRAKFILEHALQGLES
jgi:hypothetical protein